MEVMEQRNYREDYMESDKLNLRKNTALFWFTLAIPIGIIGIGINFIFNPVGASTGYGIPIHDPNSFPFMWIKGIRDIFLWTRHTAIFVYWKSEGDCNSIRHCYFYSVL